MGCVSSAKRIYIFKDWIPLAKEWSESDTREWWGSLKWRHTTLDRTMFATSTLATRSKWTTGPVPTTRTLTSWGSRKSGPTWNTRCWIRSCTRKLWLGHVTCLTPRPSGRTRVTGFVMSSIAYIISQTERSHMTQWWRNNTRPTAVATSAKSASSMKAPQRQPRPVSLRGGQSSADSARTRILSIEDCWCTKCRGYKITPVVVHSHSSSRI